MRSVQLSITLDEQLVGFLSRSAGQQPARNAMSASIKAGAICRSATGHETETVVPNGEPPLLRRDRLFRVAAAGLELLVARISPEKLHRARQRQPPSLGLASC
jgi:hypothetical protein